jgi:hypothetical protein
MDLHAPSIAILVLTALVFLSYLFLCGRCEALGEAITRWEDLREKTHSRYLTEQMEWESKLQVATIRQLLALHHLDMDWPDERHVFRVPQSALEAFEQRAAPAERVEIARTAVGGAGR